MQFFLKARQKAGVLGHSACGHRPLFLLGLLLAFCLAGSPSAQAFDCVKAYLPVDFVICSDPAVLNANEAHEKAWYDTRARLTDAGKQELLADQRQWLKEFPPRCGVPARGKRLAVISKDQQLCVAKALEERTAFLEQYHSSAAGALSSADFDFQNNNRLDQKQSAGLVPMQASQTATLIQKVESPQRMRQATFTTGVAGLDIQGSCRRSGASVICPLMVMNNETTQGVSLRWARIYDRESRVYEASAVGLVREDSHDAKLLHGLPTKGFWRFDKVPMDVSEIERLEFQACTERSGCQEVVIESPIPIG